MLVFPFGRLAVSGTEGGVEANLVLRLHDSSVLGLRTRIFIVFQGGEELVAQSGRRQVRT